MSHGTLKGEKFVYTCVSKYNINRVLNTQDYTVPNTGIYLRQNVIIRDRGQRIWSHLVLGGSQKYKQYLKAQCIIVMVFHCNPTKNII